MIWLVQLVFDCRDPDAVMQFWGRALGYRNDLIGLTPEAVREFRAANPQFDGVGRIDDRELRRMPVYIQRVPEPKAGRNRVRLEIGTAPGDLVAAAGELVRLGAAARAGAGDLLDPEGKEFSVVPAAAGGERRLRTIAVDALDPGRLLGFWSAATGYAVSGSRCDPPPSPASFQDGGFVVGGRRYGHITGMDAAPRAVRSSTSSPAWRSSRPTSRRSRRTGSMSTSTPRTRRPIWSGSSASAPLSCAGTTST